MAYNQMAYSYDRLMEDMPYPEWIEFAQAGWERYNVSPRTVVDLGCGTGNIAIPLAQSGLDVIGIDISESMLAVASRKLEQQNQTASKGGTVRWLHQDIREWELPEPMDAAISFCDCLNYLLEEDEIIQAFRRTYNGLKPGGLFLFDMHHPNLFRRYWDEQPFLFNEDDIAYIWTCDLNERRMEIDHEITIFARADDAGEMFHRIEENHVQRAYDPDWVADELQRAGFIDIGMYADFQFDPVSDETERVFFTARRG